MPLIQRVLSLFPPNLPFIQAANRAGYRVKVTGTFGCIEAAAGLHAAHEPRCVPGDLKKSCRTRAMTDGRQYKEREDQSTEHVWEVREVSGRRPQLEQEQPDGRAAFGEDARDSDGSVGVGIEKQVHGHQGLADIYTSKKNTK
ncbi:hypothetical protein EYF80_030302 [Liparis tanakae]|uniref:Uncharacterized protein n=1 Tax=Liparis tanakae TaxID=230148 RepID=A0A4Z2H0U4_9TELE|nr:hypothetical protein EYF80_030302 [Liparis tanakae]